MKNGGGKDFAKPLEFAISWTHSPVASKLGASPLKQSRHNVEFHLMKYSKLSRCFASELFCRCFHFLNRFQIKFIVICVIFYYNNRVKFEIFPGKRKDVRDGLPNVVPALAAFQL